MKLAVTGTNGQVARSLVERARRVPGIEVQPLGRPELLLEKPDTIAPAIRKSAPDILVSAAAYTKVDQAEDQPELAYAVNATAAGHVSTVAAELGIPIIHLSTDYVFGGAKPGPHSENDSTDPQCVYAATKLAGEQLVAEANPAHFILRTAWVYSPFGNNFVKTMLRLAAERETLTVVGDQWGTPTSALDIADAILRLATTVHSNPKSSTPGLYHLAGTGEASWLDLAKHVLDVSERYGGPHAELSEITTAEFPTKAKRPFDSRLSSALFAEEFGWTAPHWHQSSELVVLRLLTQEQML